MGKEALEDNKKIIQQDAHCDIWFLLLFPLYKFRTVEMCDGNGISWCVFLEVNGSLLLFKIKSCVHFIPTQKLV